jgi:hypothetical protein
MNHKQGICWCCAGQLSDISGFTRFSLSTESGPGHIVQCGRTVLLTAAAWVRAQVRSCGVAMCVKPLPVSRLVWSGVTDEFMTNLMRAIATDVDRLHNYIALCLSLTLHKLNS